MPKTSQTTTPTTPSKGIEPGRTDHATDRRIARAGGQGHVRLCRSESRAFGGELKPDEPLQVIAGAPDKPLVIGEIEIPCYVLEDETRVVSQRGATAAIGLNPEVGFRMPQFVASKAIKPFVSNDLMPALEQPIQFKNPSGGGTVYGYSATILVDICEAVLDANKAGALPSKHQIYR